MYLRIKKRPESHCARDFSLLYTEGPVTGKHIAGTKRGKAGPRDAHLGATGTPWHPSQHHRGKNTGGREEEKENNKHTKEEAGSRRAPMAPTSAPQGKKAGTRKKQTGPPRRPPRRHKGKKRKGRNTAGTKKKKQGPHDTVKARIQDRSISLRLDRPAQGAGIIFRKTSTKLISPMQKVFAPVSETSDTRGGLEEHVRD